MYFIDVLCLKSLNNRHSTLTLTTIVYRLLAYQKAVEKGLFGGGLVSRVMIYFILIFLKQ